MRHPDVPVSIFADFWQTIQRDDIWTGVVKNRRKNGDGYWVRANATAIVKEGKINLAVRTVIRDVHTDFQHIVQQARDNVQYSHVLGRGFAVVASEIRLLAENTSNAANEIKTLIETAQEKTQIGRNNTESAAQIMNEVVEAITASAEMLANIRQAADGQMQDVSEISMALRQLTTTTEENNKMAYAIYSSAQAVEQSAYTGQHTMQVFRVDGQDRSLAQLDAVKLRRQGQRLAHEQRGSQGLNHQQEQNAGWLPAQSGASDYKDGFSERPYRLLA